MSELAVAMLDRVGLFLVGAGSIYITLVAAYVTTPDFCSSVEVRISL